MTKAPQFAHFAPTPFCTLVWWQHSDPTNRWSTVSAFGPDYVELYRLHCERSPRLREIEATKVCVLPGHTTQDYGKHEFNWPADAEAVFSLCRALSVVYTCGQEDKLRELRNFLGVTAA